MSTNALALDSVRRALKSRIGNLTDELMDQELRWTLQEFLSFTQVWRHVETVNLIQGQTDYQIQLNVVNPAFVAQTILGAWNDKSPLTLAVDLAAELSRINAGTGEPARVELAGGTHLRVSPAPAQSGGNVYALLAMTADPSLPLTEIPSPALPYTDALVSGTLGRLHAMDAKPWSNALLVRFHVARFHSIMSSARAAAKAGRSNRNAPWRFPRFGA
jgi:hypothetical protein